MKRLENKVAIIMGRVAGMGEWHVPRFIGEGVKVVLTDINAEKD